MRSEMQQFHMQIARLTTLIEAQLPLTLRTEWRGHHMNITTVH